MGVRNYTARQRVYPSTTTAYNGVTNDGASCPGHSRREGCKLTASPEIYMTNDHKSEFDIKFVEWGQQ